MKIEEYYSIVVVKSTEYDQIESIKYKLFDDKNQLEELCYGLIEELNSSALYLDIKHYVEVNHLTMRSLSEEDILEKLEKTRQLLYSYLAEDTFSKEVAESIVRYYLKSKSLEYFRSLWFLEHNLLIRNDFLSYINMGTPKKIIVEESTSLLGGMKKRLLVTEAEKYLSFDLEIPYEINSNNNSLLIQDYYYRDMLDKCSKKKVYVFLSKKGENPQK